MSARFPLSRRNGHHELHAGHDPRPVVAAFDFDGTLSRRDTLLPFLMRLRGPGQVALALARHGWPLVEMLAGRLPRDDVKDRFLFGLLAGVELDRAERTAQAYAALLAAGDRLRADIWGQARRHREAGHRTVIVSASPELYVAPLGKRLGFDGVLATRLEVGPDGRLTGRLDASNCRGPEKVRRLDAWLGGEDVRVVGYGDSAGDSELLARADVAVWVGRRRAPVARP